MFIDKTAHAVRKVFKFKQLYKVRIIPVKSSEEDTKK